MGIWGSWFGLCEYIKASSSATNLLGRSCAAPSRLLVLECSVAVGGASASGSPEVSRVSAASGGSGCLHPGPCGNAPPNPDFRCGVCYCLQVFQGCVCGPNATYCIQEVSGARAVCRPGRPAGQARAGSGFL